MLWGTADLATVGPFFIPGTDTLDKNGTFCFRNPFVCTINGAVQIQLGQNPIVLPIEIFPWVCIPERLWRPPLHRV